MALFPDMDQQLLERALEACGNDLDLTIKRLNELSLGSADSTSDTGMWINNQQSSQDTHVGENPASEDTTAQDNLPNNGSEWVDFLVTEMMKASDMDGAKGRALRLLEAFEKYTVSRAAEHFNQKENTLKEQHELLKRAVRIQHIREQTILKRMDERQKENDERIQELQKQLVETQQEDQKKSQELQQVKQLLSQSQVECFAATMQLRQALLSNSSIPDRFYPHVF